MTTTKRWFRKMYPDTQTSNETIEISWSSSESDNEVEMILHCNKKPNISRQLDNYNASPPLSMNSYNDDKLSTRCISPSTQISLSQYTEPSPIIGAKLPDSSPILYSFSNIPPSPILGSRSALKRLRFRNRNKIIDTSPEPFRPPTPITIMDTPEDIKSQSSSEVISSGSSYEKLNNTFNIESFPSQEISQIEIKESNSTNSSSGNSLYCELRPKKKKHKKGGLAAQLDQVIRLARSRVSLWEHEMYIGRTSDENPDELIKFKLNLSWKEYGNTLMECELEESNTIFLIVLGSIQSKVIFKENCRYKLYPPYTETTTLYKQSQVKVFYNATKFVQIKP